MDLCSERWPGQAPVDPELEKLVLKMMTENPSWGSDRIVGALANLHYQISDSTVDNFVSEMAFHPHRNGARAQLGASSSGRIGRG